MSPADAAALLDEPDWIEFWDALKPASSRFRGHPAPLARMAWDALRRTGGKLMSDRRSAA